MEKKFDAVVIGAGNGGLIAATTLAKNNQKVLLLERHNVPGGFATSFVRGRFEFDPSLHELCDLGNKTNPGFVYKLFQELDIKVNWKPVPEAFQIITKINDFKYELTFPFGLEDFARKCEKYVPNSYESVVKFLKICQELKRAIAYLQEVKGNPDTKYLKKHFPNYLTTAPYTLKEVLDQLKVPLLTQNFIEAYWSYLGVPSNRVSFTLYAIMFYEYIAFGAYIPTNRSNEISQTILTRFQALGGEVWFNTPAEEIIVKNNRVVGVRTKHGIIHTNYVISNVSPHIVYGQLINSADIPAYDKKLVNTRKPGVQGFSVYLGLDISVEKLGLKHYSYFVSKDLISDKQFNRMKTLSNTEDYIVVALNNANKQASEPNTSILSFTTLFIDAWKNVTEKEYFKLKNEIASKMIKHFEILLGINIREHIEEIEIATPVTFARYTGAINGAIYGYDATPFDSTFTRSACIDADVNIDGLRFCGGNSFRGHGYSTTYLSGNTMAMKTFSEMLEDPALIAERQLRTKLAEEKLVADQKARSLKHKILTEKQLSENEKQRLLLLKNGEENRLKAAADYAKLQAETLKDKMLAKENAKNILAKITEQKNAGKQLSKVEIQLELENKRRIRFITKQVRLVQRDIDAGKIGIDEAKIILSSHIKADSKSLIPENALVPKKLIDKQKAEIVDHNTSKSEKQRLKQQRKIDKQLANIEKLKTKRQNVEEATLLAQQIFDNSKDLVVKKKAESVEINVELTEQQKNKTERLRLKQQKKLAKQNARNEKKRMRAEQKAAWEQESLTPEQAAILAQRQQFRVDKLEIKKERAQAKQASKEAKLKIVEARQQANITNLITQQVEIEKAIANAQKIDINTSAVKAALEQAIIEKPLAPIKQLEMSKDYSKDELCAEKLRIKLERKQNKDQAKAERKQLKLDKKEAKYAAKELAKQNGDAIFVANDNIVINPKTSKTKDKVVLSSDLIVCDDTIKINRNEILDEMRKIKAERKLAKHLEKMAAKQGRIAFREQAKQERALLREQTEQSKQIAVEAVEMTNFKRTKPIGYSGMDEQIVELNEQKKSQHSLVPNKNISNEIAPMAHSLFKFSKIKRFGKEKNIYEFSDMIEYKIEKYLRKTYVRHNKLLNLEQIEAKKIASVEMLRDSLITNKRLLKLAILSENENKAAQERNDQLIDNKKAKINVATNKPQKNTTKNKSVKSSKPEPKIKIKSEAKIKFKPEPKTKVEVKSKPETKIKPSVKFKIKPENAPTVNVTEMKNKTKKSLFKKQKINVIKYSYEHAKVVENKVNSLKQKKDKNLKITKVKTIKHPIPLSEPIAKKKVNRR